MCRCLWAVVTAAYLAAAEGLREHSTFHLQPYVAETNQKCRAYPFKPRSFFLRDGDFVQHVTEAQGLIAQISARLPGADNQNMLTVWVPYEANGVQEYYKYIQLSLVHPHLTLWPFMYVVQNDAPCIPPVRSAALSVSQPAVRFFRDPERNFFGLNVHYYSFLNPQRFMPILLHSLCKRNHNLTSFNRLSCACLRS